MKYQKHLILGISLLILGSYSVIFGQSLNEAFPSVKADSSLPLITYQVGDNTYSSKEKGTKIEIIFNSIPYSYGLKGSIILKNISSDTLQLHNVVPLGRGDDHIYITGKGKHGLSRTYLFRPGFAPVNVIVPDNAWNLGFSTDIKSGDKRLAALVRRVPNSLKKGVLSRFETKLFPGGEIGYTFWMDYYVGDWQEGLKLMFQKRYLYDVEPGCFSDSILKREDLKWFRKCYSVDLMMNWDKRFYDYKDGAFHVKEFLEKMKGLMGGYDVYGIWPTWPALGMDQRNQWEMFRDLPGGYKKLKEISNLCHNENAKFFISYNPWDQSTNDSGNQFEGMTEITKAIDVDGFVLDTTGKSSWSLQHAADRARPGVIMYSEGMAVPKDMQGIPSGRVHNALYYCPMLNLNKLIRPDFAIFRVAEENKEPIRREFNVSFFNGYGTEINSFAAGRFEWSDNQMRYWGKLLRIQRENSENFISEDYKPLVKTLVDSIYVNQWPGENKTIYTVYNLRPQGFKGLLFEVTPTDATHYVDIYLHEEIIPQKVKDISYLPVQVESFDSFELGTNNESSISAIAQLPRLLNVSLKSDELTISASKGNLIRIWAGLPSYEKRPKEFTITKQTIRLLDEFSNCEGKFVIQLFDNGILLDENILFIKPGTARMISTSNSTVAVTKAPKGMVTIPAGVFQCNEYRTGDNFILYPDNLPKRGEKVQMSKFYMDQYPVTNKQYKEFLDKSGYQPKDTTNFLKHWIKGEIPEGKENFPVIYVTLEDAQAYAKWAGKRIPTEIEWQYAAQAGKQNEWPWVQKNPVKRVEDSITATLSVWKLEGIESDRCNLGDGNLYPVGKYPKGKNPFGLYDLVGCVWQLTNDVFDNATYRYVMVKGGSYFLPSSSWWYVQGGPRELNYRQYLLRVSPSFERNATVGFRCVKDAK
jgi:iron(II)-dependent oxidoreductase